MALQIEQRGAPMPAARGTTPGSSTKVIRSIDDLKDVLEYLQSVIAKNASAESAKAGITGAVPKEHRRVEEEVDAGGMQTANLINRGVRQCDWFRNILRAIYAIKQKVQLHEFSGEWSVERVTFWQSTRRIHLDPSSTDADADAKMAVAAFLPNSAGTVQVLDDTTPENQRNPTTMVEGLGITVHLVDLLNAAPIKRVQGNPVEGQLQPTDASQAIVSALTKLANNAGAPSAPEPVKTEAPPATEEKVHHKVAQKMERLEREAEEARARVAELQALLAAKNGDV